MLLDSLKKVMKSGFETLALVINRYRENFFRTGPISYKALTKKGIVKKNVDHLWKKKAQKMRFILRCSQKNGTYIGILIRPFTNATVNSPVTVNNLSQNINAVTYPERFSYRYAGMGAQILALKKMKIYLYLHYYFESQAMFLPF